MNKQLSNGFTTLIIAGVAILALVVLGLAGNRSGSKGGEPAGGPRTGHAAPALAGKSTDSKSVSLADYKGKVVLLNFWATWCGPCRQELPSIAALHEKYKDRGLVVLGIASDETPEPVNEFLKENPLPFTNVYNTNEIKQAYAIQALPTTVLIDKEGQMVFDIDGYNPNLDLGALVEKYL
jgi:thiol-disulfide isomerase/thioredoxin